MRTKEERLANKDRIKKKRSHYWGQDLTDNGRMLNIVSETPAKCSCFMCGNPRKYFNSPTLQEQSFDELNRNV